MKKKNSKKRLCTMMVFAILGLGACDTNQGPLEKAGESLDEASEDASNSVGETLGEVGDEIDDAS